MKNKFTRRNGQKKCYGRENETKIDGMKEERTEGIEKQIKNTERERYDEDRNNKASMNERQMNRENKSKKK